VRLPICASATIAFDHLLPIHLAQGIT
jgi:hypothetical protein